MGYSTSLNQNIIVLAEYSPVSIRHLLYWLIIEIFSLMEVISWLPIGFLILFLLLILIEAPNESFAKQYLRVMFICIERIDILRSVLTCIPVHHEYLFELITVPDNPLLILNHSHVLPLYHLNLLLIDEHLLLQCGSFGLLELFGFFFFLIFPLPPGFPLVTVVPAVTVIVISSISRSASISFGMIHGIRCEDFLLLTL